MGTSMSGGSEPFRLAAHPRYRRTNPSSRPGEQRLLEPSHQLLMPRRLDGGGLAHEADRSARLEDRAIDLGEGGEALPVRGGLQLRRGEELVPQALGLDLAVLDEQRSSCACE